MFGDSAILVSTETMPSPSLYISSICPIVTLFSLSFISHHVVPTLSMLSMLIWLATPLWSAHVYPFIFWRNAFPCTLIHNKRLVICISNINPIRMIRVSLAVADDIYYFVNEMQKWRVLYYTFASVGRYRLPTLCAVSASFQSKKGR